MDNNINLTEWQIWFTKFVTPLFEVEGREGYFEYLKKKQTPFYPRYWVAEKFYETIKNDNRFDEELKMFFSFLYSCGFFMENVITFDEWIKMKNWVNPSNSSLTDETILEIIEKPNGVATLKSKLRWFPFLHRSDGY
ncbi:hypothetical protein [Dyadobacter sp. 32]|uniref:hypothetical protein n=1 Tax=Dyadobacter sp. 32 TaxID=538966 RepID=UPI0011EC26CB